MMRPHIEELANELLDQVKGERRVDVVGALAHPLPSLVICEMLGVPKDDRPRFSAWTEDIAFLIGPLIEPDRLEAGERAAGEFMDYVRILVAERRKAPSDDLLSALIGAGEDGDRLSVDELVATVVFLFSAGHQTTRDLTGNGLLALLPHSEQTDRLVAEPDLLLEAVEECLRYDPSVTLTARRALEEVSIRGRKISAGDHVILSISAANRDPAIFSDPDRFDIERPFKEHLTFGGGIHYCLGATLARLELQIIFGCLLRRYPGLRLADEPVRWRQTATFRGPLAVEVVLG
jgi:cytochrome P450